MLCCALTVAAGAAPLTRVPVGAAAPQSAITGLDGHDMSAASARGHHLLVTFSDAKSRDAGFAFFRAHATKLAGVDGLVLHNVVVPGGVMLTPRAVILSRVRSDAAKLEREVRAALGPADRAAFERVTVRWHIDFDRKYTELFGAPPHQVSLVLVGPDGRVRDSDDNASAPTVERLLGLVGRQPRR